MIAEGQKASTPLQTTRSSLYERLIALPGKATIMAIAAEAISDVAVLNALFAYTYGGVDPLRWRAAWAIEKVSASKPLLVVGERNRMIRLLMQNSTPTGLKRLLLHILYNLPEGDSLDVGLFNFLIDIMVDFRSSSGVQSLAMKLADRMSRFDADLHEEYLCVLRNMELEYYSSGVKAVARECLKCKYKMRI